ncbi:MAG: hypothetical protein AAFY88_29320, partial [Acidobacteriota bacterium]
TYLISTDAGPRYVDQLWQGVRCPAGPAFLGLCDLALATPVDLIDPAELQELELTLETIDLLFGDGFESGDLGAWSSSVP